MAEADDRAAAIYADPANLEQEAVEAARVAIKKEIEYRVGMSNPVPLPRVLAEVAVEAARPIIEAEVMERANLVTVDLRKLREVLQGALHKRMETEVDF